MKQNRSVAPSPGLAVPHGLLPILCFATKHWLALFTLLASVYFLLALAAPVCMALGWTRTAELIHALYAHTCHQLPKASYFLLGQETLWQIDSDPVGSRAARSFLGDALLGYKTALCQRNLATYSAFALMGMMYIKTGWRLNPLPFWAGVLCIMPMAADGLSQMLGFRESHWLLRSLTGILFSAGVAGTLWPRIQPAMEEVNRSLSRAIRERSS